MVTLPALCHFARSTSPRLRLYPLLENRNSTGTSVINGISILAPDATGGGSGGGRGSTATPSTRKSDETSNRAEKSGGREAAGGGSAGFPSGGVKSGPAAGSAVVDVDLAG